HRCADTARLQSSNRTPLVHGTQHRQPQGTEVLEDFDPADAAMRLDEVRLRACLEAYRAAARNFPEHLAGHVHEHVERNVSTQRLFQCGSDVELRHEEAASLFARPAATCSSTSAARCGRTPSGNRFI